MERINPVIRPEGPADLGAVRELNTLAFERPGEALAVDALRAAGKASLSLVAELGGAVVGHVLFSPVTLDNTAAPSLLGLAPLAVTPAKQGEGIGATLVHEGLDACRDLGVGAVVLLGHPGYYPRFGFRPAPPLGLQIAGYPDCEAFFAIELMHGTLAGLKGEIRFDPAFDGL